MAVHSTLPRAKYICHCLLAKIRCDRNLLINPCAQIFGIITDVTPCSDRKLNKRVQSNFWDLAQSLKSLGSAVG